MLSDADNMGFDKVPTKPDFFSTAILQRIINHTKGVVLLYKGAEVRIQEISLIETGLLAGQVAGFSNICSTQYEELKIGQFISFRYAHIQHFA